MSTIRNRMGANGKERHMEPTTFLRLAYAANLFILVPVVPALAFGGGVASVFDGKVDESAGLRLLVASLWGAILVASAIGLIWPRPFWPVLLVQIVYKSAWLIVFVWPLWRAGGADVVPLGVAGTFVAIVGTYPFLLWFGTR